jgi:hypothetical protein
MEMEMHRVFALLFLLAFVTSPLFASDISSLENAVMKHATTNPDTAYEYFLKQIEAGATPEQQAVYLYGMGLVNQAKGNVAGAINDYMTAEILGNESASRALIRLRKNNKKD